MKFNICKSSLITFGTLLMTGFGKFKTSKRSKTVLEAPGVLLYKNDKIAYLLAAPPLALCKT